MKFLKFVFLTLILNLLISILLKNFFKKEIFQELKEDLYSNEKIRETLDFL